MKINDSVTLNNGVIMPRIGLGVYRAHDGEEDINAIKAAVNTGY